MRIADTVLQLLATTAYIDIILLLVTGTSKHLILIIEPVHRTPNVHIAVIAMFAHIYLILISHIIIRVKYFGKAGYLLHAERSSKIHLHFSLFTAFGRNDDNSVGATCTINSGRRGIFQHIDALNLGRGDIADARHRKSIHNVQR